MARVAPAEVLALDQVIMGSRSAIAAGWLKLALFIFGVTG
jgi:hypothetical protein